MGWHFLFFLRRNGRFWDFFLIFLDFFEMNSGRVNGMTMSLELVDVMESSPVATMNHSIFW